MCDLNLEHIRIAKCFLVNSVTLATAIRNGHFTTLNWGHRGFCWSFANGYFADQLRSKCNTNSSQPKLQYIQEICIRFSLSCFFLVLGLVQSNVFISLRSISLVPRKYCYWLRTSIGFGKIDHTSHKSTWHYNDVIMSVMASESTSLMIVCLTVYWGADQRKHQSSASLAFVRGIHRWPVNSPHKGPVTRKMFPFDDVIMNTAKQNPEHTAWDVLYINDVSDVCYAEF